MSSAFDKAERNSPSVPNETCPVIDPVIEGIDDSMKKLQEAGQLIQEASLILDNFTGRRGSLEELRDDNIALRESGIYWREQCKDMSDQILVLEAETETFVSCLQEVSLVLKNAATMEHLSTMIDSTLGKYAQ